MTFSTTWPRPARRTFAAIGCLALLGTAAARAQGEGPQETLAEELVVVESSILLQRADRTRVDNLEVEIDGSLADVVAVYPIAEVEFPTTVYVDLCASSFSRLTRAVGMIASISERLLEWGPITVVAGGDEEDRALLEASTDALSFEAALTLILRAPLGGCEDSTALAALARMRRALSVAASQSTAPSLLLVYGFDHGAITAEDLRRFQPEYAATGAELAGQGRTTVVLVPAEGDRRLKEEEVRSLLPDPEGPPRVINLGAVLGAILAPKRQVPADPRIIEIATDPRHELVRDLITVGHGRLFAFPRQLEAFVRDLASYHVLFYRSSFRESEPGGTLVPIEVRTGSGQVIVSSALTTRARP